MPAGVRDIVSRLIRLRRSGATRNVRGVLEGIRSIGVIEPASMCLL